MIPSEWFSLAADTSPAWWLMAVPVASSLLYWGIADRLSAAWCKRRSQPSPEALPPVVFFRPVKRGLPRVEEKARALLRSARRGDRVIFGVSTVEDETSCLAACRESTPEGVEGRVVFCHAPPSEPVNPKVHKLIAMTAEAEAMEAWSPEHWIISDAEALPDRALMDAFRAEWLISGHSAFTAGYRFTPAGTWPELLDRLPLLLTLWPGLLAAQAGGGERGLGFALGACMAVRRADLEKIGGWSRLLRLLAEDNRLGAYLQKAGMTTGLSRQVITLEGDVLGWREWLWHQHRVARTYRVCSPWGTLGMGLTHGISWAALLLLALPNSLVAWALFAATVLLRVIFAQRMNARLSRICEASLLRFTAGTVMSSVVESICWLLAWFPLPVRWNDRSLNVSPSGYTTGHASHSPSLEPHTRTVALNQNAKQ